MKLRNRKITLFFIGVIFFILLIQWIVPAVLLQISKPDVSSDSKSKELSHYINTFDESLKRFYTYEEALKKEWSKVELKSPEVGETGLKLDYLSADANERKKNLIIFTSAVHGVEGYVGSSMLDVIVKDFLPEFNPADTGLIMVHAANPWGMKNFRRYNENNIDLNRNFITDWNTFDRSVNKDYTEVRTFFEKSKPLGNSTLHELGFLGSLGREVIQSGTKKIEDALLTGQFTNPSGVYYGGTEDADSTKLLKQVYQDAIDSDYQNIVHIDLHTGYGPRDQMSIFSAVNETMKQKEAVKAFDYPLVLTPESEDFYVTSGDNTAYFSELYQKQAPDKLFYSTTFEFGTLGNGLLASISSLKQTIDENRLFHQGSSNETTKEIIKNRYLEMFYPSEEEWRLKAIKDFKRGLTGVLSNRGVIQ